MWLTSALRVAESLSDLVRGWNPVSMADTGRAAEDLPLDETGFVVLDTELTGLDPERDEILAVGAVRMVGPRILVGETFYRLVRPSRRAWGATVPIHRIRPVDVAEAPPIGPVLAELEAFCGDRVRVGQMVGLDRSFLERARRTDGRRPGGLWIDTGQVEWWLATEGGRYRHRHEPTEFLDLARLARRYGLEATVAHQALADAFVTAQVWQRQLLRLREHGVVGLRDLVLIGRT